VGERGQRGRRGEPDQDGEGGLPPPERGQVDLGGGPPDRLGGGDASGPVRIGREQAGQGDVGQPGDATDARVDVADSGRRQGGRDGYRQLTGAGDQNLGGQPAAQRHRHPGQRALVGVGPAQGQGGGL